MGKRIKRALRATISKIGYQNKLNITISTLVFVISLFIFWKLVGVEQMTEQIPWWLAVFAALGVVFILLFLLHLIRPPAPKRDGTNFLLTYRERRIVTGESVGLPPAQDNMRWVQVYTYIEVRFRVKIETLVLMLKGKPIMAEGWRAGVLPAGSSHQQYYYFQIPTSVDLTRHKAELVTSTNDEDYGSGEFTIEQ